RIFFHPIFAERYATLESEVERLHRTLAAGRYKTHPRVKLFVALYRLIYEIVPSDPTARRFVLKGELARFRRAKGEGLPSRYRLFWVFSTSQRAIIFLYLNDDASLRKEGSSTDPYVVFRGLV